MKLSASKIAELATPAARLGLVRVLVGGYTLYHLSKRRKLYQRVNRTDPEMFQAVGPCRVLPEPISPKTADAINDATLVTTALFTLGIGHRSVGKLHSALLLWTLSYRNSWSMTYHNDNTLVLHTLVLGASRAADAVSVDALVKHARPEPHPRYGWPLQLMNAASTMTYLLAGIAKVAGNTGWAWGKGDNLRRQIAADTLYKKVYQYKLAPTSYELYRHRRLFTVFAVGSLALELLAPLGVLHRKLGWLWAVCTFGMHWSIKVIMGIKFPYQLAGVSFASWFEVEKLAKFLLFWRR